MAHDRLTHVNQHSKYPKKGEIKLISKKVLRKRKEKIFKIEKLITGPCEAI